VVCASPAEGGAQTALATVARRLDKRATIFVARRAKPHPRTVEAAKLGAQIIGVAPGYLIGQIRQDDKANVVLGEALSVSVEPKPLEPVRYLLHRLPARLNRQAPHSPEPINSSRDFVAAPPCSRQVRSGSITTNRRNKRRVGFAPESRNHSGHPKSTLSANTDRARPVSNRGAGLRGRDQPALAAFYNSLISD
jgi:hypothetical protein